MNYNIIYSKLKVTYFQNRFASDNVEVKQKAAAEGRTSAVTLHDELNWSEFVGEVLDHTQWSTFTANNSDEYNNAKAQFDAVVFAQMVEGASRSAKNVIAHYAVVLDIDDGITANEVITDLSEYEFVLYSSGGTGIKAGERFRVVLPLAKTLNADEWCEWSESLKKRFYYSDASFSKSLQIQYLPQLNTVHASKFISHHNAGRLLDVMADVPYVKPYVAPVPSMYINPVHPVQYSMTDSALITMMDALKQHSAGQLGLGLRWYVAGVLRTFGVNDIDIINVLDVVSRYGFTTPNSEVLKTCEIMDGAKCRGIRKYLPSGYKLPMPEIKPQYQTVKPLIRELTQYNYDITLNHNQFLSDVADQFEIKPGINMGIIDCSAGKSYYCSRLSNAKMICPLLSIVEQNTQEGAEFNNIIDGGVATFHQIDKILKDVENHDKYKDMVLVVDEAHGLYLDSYRDDVNRTVHKCFDLFKSVLLMSGTIRPEYFSHLNIVNTIRVRKVQQFEKVLTRIQCESDVVGTAIKHITDRQIKNKMVIFLNNIDDIKAMRQKLIGINSLEYTALTKNTAEVKAFLQSSVLDNYDCLIGTNSIVEGLNINDELPNCEVHVIGNCSPERIEQVTNRWRKCSGTIHTYHYTDSVLMTGDLPEQENITMQDYIDVATDSVKNNNRFIKLLGDKRRKQYINTYIKENHIENVYWDKETKKFEVNYLHIDYQMASNRFERSQCDYQYYAGQLAEYGFKFTVPQRSVLSTDITEERKAVKHDKKQQHEATIDLVISQYDERGWSVTDDTPEAQVQRDFVDGFVRRGLKRTDVVEYLTRLRKKADYWKRLSRDLENARNGNSVTDLIIRELPNHLASYAKGKKQGLTVQSKRELAELVTRFVLNERFNGDIVQMKLGGWGSVLVNATQLSSISLINGKSCVALLDSQDKTPDEVLNRFITLGKSKPKRIDGIQSRITPVKFTSLTGFDFDIKNDSNTDLADAIKAKKQSVLEAVVLNVEPIVSEVITQSQQQLKLKNSILNRWMI